jgi:DNA-binding MarR family transcriptional regulator
MLVAISAHSIAAVEDIVDLTQLRALVIVSSRGTPSLSELADAVRLHLSRASRMCGRMVGGGLQDRAQDPANRRQVMLTATEQGHAIVASVIAQRSARADGRRDAALAACTADDAGGGVRIARAGPGGFPTGCTTATRGSIRC